MVIPREPPLDTKLSNGGLRRDYTPAPQVTKAYLIGVLHDASVRRNTYRVATNNFPFCEFLVKGIKSLGAKTWFYKEGKNRNLWIVEFSKKLLMGVSIKSGQEKRDYIRGYFDAEGGIAKSSKVRFYLYFAQKDKKDLSEVRNYLIQSGISCGILHNPSKKVDPNYWRFFIRARSYKDFAARIGSGHPEKGSYLRMMI